MSKNKQYTPEDMLRDILEKHNVSHDLFSKLLKEEKVRVHLQRRRGIVEQLRQIVEQHESKGDRR